MCGLVVRYARNIQENSAAASGVVHKNVGNSDDELAVLDDGTSRHPDAGFAADA